MANFKTAKEKYLVHFINSKTLLLNFSLRCILALRCSAHVHMQNSDPKSWSDGWSNFSQLQWKCEQQCKWRRQFFFSKMALQVKWNKTKKSRSKIDVVESRHFTWLGAQLKIGINGSYSAGCSQIKVFCFQMSNEGSPVLKIGGQICSKNTQCETEKMTLWNITKAKK